MKRWLSRHFEVRFKEPRRVEKTGWAGETELP